MAMLVSEVREHDPRRSARAELQQRGRRVSCWSLLSYGVNGTSTRYPLMSKNRGQHADWCDWCPVALTHIEFWRRFMELANELDPPGDA
jgi:hypothetical protein